MKPVVFIGSTSEGELYAKAAKSHLRDLCNCKVWTDGGIFEIAGNTQQSLIEEVGSADFVIVFLTADDATTSRENDYFSPRDNLVFEAGMGFGSIGSNRVFLIPESAKDLKMPSDLSGFTLGTPFDRSDEPKEAIGASMEQVEERVRELGRKPIIKLDGGREIVTNYAIDLIESADRQIIMSGRDLSWAESYAPAIATSIGRGVNVQVFAEIPKSELALKSSSILKDAGAEVHYLDFDLGIKFTIIDSHNASVARFMVTSKERKTVGAERNFNYKCEIHNGSESKALYESLISICEIASREANKETGG